MFDGVGDEGFGDLGVFGCFGGLVDDVVAEDVDDHVVVEVLVLVWVG